MSKYDLGDLVKYRNLTFKVIGVTADFIRNQYRYELTLVDEIHQDALKKEEKDNE